VLTDKKWTTRQPLMRLQAQAPLAAQPAVSAEAA